MNCPHCHRPLHLPEELSTIQFSRLENRIVTFLAQTLGHEVPAERILDAMYGDDPDGGPEGGNKVLTVIAHRIRTKINPHGYTLRGHCTGGRHGGSAYTLTKEPK